MTIKITLGVQQIDTSIPNVELIPNPDGIQPVDYCQTCAGVRDIFWNGKQTICISCDKGRPIRKKLGLPMVDEGISLSEFFARLRERSETYGMD